MERYEFSYNLARMSVTALLNIQMATVDRITPSQLWPDWNTDNSVDDNEKIDPDQLAKIARSAIDFLNKKSDQSQPHGH